MTIATTTDLGDARTGEPCVDGAAMLPSPRRLFARREVDDGRSGVTLPIEWVDVVALVRRQMRSFVGGGSRRDLDDLTQTALERIYRSADRFEGRADLATYTYKVCAHVALNHWRWYKRWLRRFERATDDTPEPESVCDVVGDAIERERFARLERALERMTPVKRAVITLCELEELPASRVSEILGCPEATVRSRLHQARIDLTRLLREDERSFESERSK